VMILHPRKTTSESPTLPDSGDADVQRISLRDIQSGKLAANVTIRDGDTIFVPKAQRFYVTGNVRTPGAYVLEPNLTVLQAISMAGGATERGSTRRLRIIRNKKEIDVKPEDIVQADDTIVVRQRLL
jgi:polysaccharide biosynthesis/export protein